MPPGRLTSALATSIWRRRHPAWAGGRPGHVPPTLQLRPRTLPRTVTDSLAVRWAARRAGADKPPWLTADAVAALDDLLLPDDRALEWGSGGTTLWLAPRVASVTSVEGARAWHDDLSARLRDEHVENVDLHLVPFDELGYETPEHEAAYVGAAPELEPESLGLVLVDGEYRDRCALRGLSLLRPGGLLVLDNAETYLPSTTRSPWHVSRPATPHWAELVERTRGWRRLWTTNGVWDTALWIKPGR
ncbi:class I SAM-dependent methyltransferase [Aeromicrobium sp. 50.2.37]|uniref:class I SAM-dependent methyltransferase n=1 Tax=Aeromicrobium sp. 50.2.37 TaxID=2969305 RepID=UPI002150369E|nr:class I SAM-dependent methyltransferase [Aeromicrobium sp. 50.2.37]MCR4514754.1 class I SAM-dependent methyltransferase [Aeromicrobium sp. 50.2.37]